MSTIIEMLFENPIIIIVIMGILSSLFSKKKTVEPRNKRIPPKKTVFQRQEDRERVPPPPQSPAQAKNQTFTQPIQTIASETNELLEKAELAEARKKKEEAKENPIKLESVEHGDLTKKKFKLDPKSDQVLQGLIWAEILAAPKAKRKQNI